MLLRFDELAQLKYGNDNIPGWKRKGSVYIYMILDGKLEGYASLYIAKNLTFRDVY